ncbi:MAG: hypothetical protein KKE94_06755 [Gammaproteobacteria bacterium]|nr:hypothetical protein [Gammaproteobacteria bacterium]
MDQTILTKFLRQKKIARNAPAKYQEVFAFQLQRLQQYIDTGIYGDTPSEGGAEWESIFLGIPSVNYLQIAQAAYVQTGQIDYPSVQRALAYAYVFKAIDHHILHHFPAKFGREYGTRFRVSDIFHLCAAMVLGLTHEACQMYEVLAAGYQRGAFTRSKAQFADFVLQLLASYRGESLPLRVQPFAYADWLANWQSTDLSQVQQLLLNICDEQVRLASAPPSKDFDEFRNGYYNYVPWTAMLLLTLRQRRGLANPEVEHPAFGKLNALLPAADLPLVYDDVLTKVMLRMYSQGFDLQQCYALRR